MEPWYKIVTPRKEVREGRSFNPDEFAIHLEQIVNGTAPDDYKNPEQFFARTCFTSALKEHVAITLRRLLGETANTAPVMTLLTQFGGGKTHTLATLYHLTTAGDAALNFDGVRDFLNWTGLRTIPKAKVAIFVGNAWDPQVGKETPWIDLAFQIAGEKGVQELGIQAKSVPPGTETLARIFKLAKSPVLILFDEVLNYLNRHRDMSDQFHAFIQNLTVAATEPVNCAVLISLPRSQVEMTQWDYDWQEKINKVVSRVAKNLITNDETEISEVIRKRLFEKMSNERTIKNISKEYAEWCYQRRAQLPPEWMNVDSTLSESRAKDMLQQKFESCFPFHPATISVFQRKWSALSQFQQTRGTLSMLAQWISYAYRDSQKYALKEPLITLGSAPLDAPDFRSVVLNQVGEPRLQAAIDADIAGQNSHARALDLDTKDHLKNIHRKVGTAIFFESSGGQINKIAHLPELRFALGQPGVDTTTIDNAAFALEDKSYFLRKIGSDGYKIGFKPTLKKVVNDRKASLDEDTQIKPVVSEFVKKEFEKNSQLPLVLFPADSSEIQDSPRLTIIVINPDSSWSEDDPINFSISEWTKNRGSSPRLYPGALVWAIRKQGRDLKDKAETYLAWKQVKKEVTEGALSTELSSEDLAEVSSKLSGADNALKDEVWASYRYFILYDRKEANLIKVIDLGAGHSSSNESMCGRIINALKSNNLLNDSVGAGYIERNWPNALKESGAWPLSGLRQSFLDGSLTRLLDPDMVLRKRIVEFVEKGDFGLASETLNVGEYTRIWYNEEVDSAEIIYDSKVFLLLKDKSILLKKKEEPGQGSELPKGQDLPKPGQYPEPLKGHEPPKPGSVHIEPNLITLNVSGEIPFESWNRIGTKLLSKLRSMGDIKLILSASVTIDSNKQDNLEREVTQILEDLSLKDLVKIK